MRLKHKRLKHAKAARIGPVKRRVFMSAPLARSATQRPYESERGEHHDDCAKLPRSQEKVARPCDEIAGDHRWQTHGEVGDHEDHRQHAAALLWRGEWHHGPDGTFEAGAEAPPRKRSPKER